MKRLALLLFFGGLGLALSARTSQAANHYVRAAATGTGSGVDWANACNDFTGSCAAGSLVRGDTYYVANGHYAAPTFSSPTSGTLVITIKGATAADHGTSTGWSNSYGVDTGTQADFANQFHIRSSYWVFDGNTGTPAGGRKSYGFTVDPVGGTCSGTTLYVTIGDSTSSFSNIQISHFGLLGCTGDDDIEAIYECTQCVTSNDLYSYNYFDGFQVGVQAQSGTTNMTYDHNYEVNPYDSPNHHGSQVNFEWGGTTNSVVSNNFIQCWGTACIESNGVAGCHGVLNAKIFGNVIQPVSGGVGNGMIGATNGCFFQNAQIYNNTFIGPVSDNISWVSMCVPGDSSGCPNATGNVVQNNLVWNTKCSLGGGTIANDYNTYESCSDTAPTETHGQYGTSNLFVSSSTSNFHLAIDTNPWNPSGIPSGDNIDPTNIMRTSSRGADQFGASSASGPQPPVGLQVVSVD